MLDDSAFALRARHPWEAIDLGVLMLRRWWKQISPASVTIAAAASVACLVLPMHLRWLVILALWWQKPFLDRLVVVPAGVLLFSPRSKAPEITRPLLKSLRLGLIFDLTWRRLSPWRAYLLPARAFENTRGREHRSRIRGLLVENRGWVIATTALFACLEWAIAIATALTLGDLLGSDRFGLGTPGYFTLLVIVYAIVLSVIEPLYVLSCFSLYLNRRTIAEGWDIELRFKRLRAGRSQALKTIVLILLLGFGTWMGKQSMWAEDADSTQRAFADRVDSVLTDPVFGTPRMEKRLALRKDITPKKPIDASGAIGAEPGALERLASQGLRIIGAAAIASLVVIAIFAGRRRLAFARRHTLDGKGKAARPFFVKSKSPELTLEAVENLWQSGDRRAALAGLYRAAIAHGIEELEWKLDESSTETDCKDQALLSGMRGPDQAIFAAVFTPIVAAWTALAWAGKEPSVEDFERMVGALESIASGPVR